MACTCDELHVTNAVPNGKRTTASENRSKTTRHDVDQHTAHMKWMANYLAPNTEQQVKRVCHVCQLCISTEMLNSNVNTWSKIK